MNSRSHIALGITTVIVSIQFKENPDMIYMISGAFFGSIAPDIDTQRSWAAQVIPFIDDMLRKFEILKHRGITHGLSSLFVIPLYFYFQNDFMLSFMLAFISHSILDFFTSKYIRFKLRSHKDKDKKKSYYKELDQDCYRKIWILNVILIVIFYIGIDKTIDIYNYINDGFPKLVEIIKG